MAEIIPLDELYRLLVQAWGRAYPRLPAAEVQTNTLTFWRENGISAVHIKIIELNKITVLPKGQPTLHQLWFSNSKAKKTKDHAPASSALSGKGQNHSRKNKIDENRGPPIVITIDTDDEVEEVEVEKNVQSFSEPLVVLEVVDTGEEENSRMDDSFSGLEQGVVDEILLENQGVDLPETNVKIKKEDTTTEMESTNAENLDKNDTGGSPEELHINNDETSDDNHLRGLIRIRKLESLMETEFQ